MKPNLPACDLDAESAVLSAVLNAPETFDELSQLVPQQGFYADANQRVWDTLASLLESRRGVDIVTVARTLKDAGRLEDVGGTPYLSRLLNATPAVAHALDHARIVRDTWRKRRLVSVLQSRLAGLQADDGVRLDELDDWTAALGTELDSISTGSGEVTTHTIRDAVRQEMADLEVRSREERVLLGVTTGFRDLDRRILGWERKNFYVVAARPGMGKTGFLCSTSLACAEAGKATVIVSIEMPKEQIVQRLLAQIAIIDWNKIRLGRMAPDERRRVNDAAVRLSRLPMIIEESARHTPRSIRAAVRRGMRKLREHHPSVELGMIGVDYLQLVHASGEKKGQSREQEVAEVSMALREMAKSEFSCAVVALAQLNRDTEKRTDKRPQLADLRESGQIEQDAYCIIGIHREDYYRSLRGEGNLDGKADLTVLKLRGGGTGSARVNFHGPSAAFVDDPDRYDMGEMEFPG